MEAPERSPLGAGFVVRQQTAAHPLVDLRIFRSRNVAGANVARSILVIAVFSTFFLVSLYMQHQLHYTAVRTGLAFLPMVGGQRPLLARSRRPHGRPPRPEWTLLLGFALLIAGMLLLAQLPAHGSYAANLLPGLILVGAGAPVAFSPAIALAVTGIPSADLGVASGVSNVCQQVGGSVELAVVATLSETRTTSLLHAGHSLASATAGGDHLAFTVAACVLAGGFVVAALVVRPPEPPPRRSASDRSRPTRRPPDPGRPPGAAAAHRG